jgi:hypothetical protein
MHSMSIVQAGLQVGIAKTVDGLERCGCAPRTGHARPVWLGHGRCLCVASAPRMTFEDQPSRAGAGAGAWIRRKRKAREKLKRFRSGDAAGVRPQHALIPTWQKLNATYRKYEGYGVMYGVLYVQYSTRYCRYSIR